MSKSKNVAAEATVTAVENVLATPVAPVIKVTPVEERLYDIVPSEAEIKFRGKQRTIVYEALKSIGMPLNIKDVASIASEKGLIAVGGVEPSVRYHLHHLTLDGFTSVTNPTITVE